MGAKTINYTDEEKATLESLDKRKADNEAFLSNAKVEKENKQRELKNLTLTDDEKASVKSSLNLEGLSTKQAEKEIKKAEENLLKQKRKEQSTLIDNTFEEQKAKYKTEKQSITNERYKIDDAHADELRPATLPQWKLGEKLGDAIIESSKNDAAKSTAMSDAVGGQKTESELNENKANSNEHLRELKDDSNALLKAISDMTTSETEKGIKETKDLIDKLTKGDLSYSVKDMPKGIIRAFKNGDFGKLKIDPDIKADYLAEMKKPKEERDQAKIDAYKEELESVKTSHSTLGYFIVDAIGKGLSNIGTALQGGTGDKQSKWQEVQDAKLKGSLERYNKQWQELSDEMTERFKAKGVTDRQTLKDVAEIYKNQSLRPIIDKLDVDSMERTLIIAKNMGGKINFETLKNALMLQILQDPQGAISKAMGAGGDIVKMAIPK